MHFQRQKGKTQIIEKSRYYHLERPQQALTVPHTLVVELGTPHLTDRIFILCDVCALHVA